MSEMPYLLIVDDDEEFLEILQRRFSRRGFNVVACASFADAVDAAGKLRFNAALVDRTLPGANDLDLVTKLKALDADLPLIVLSGWSGPAFVAEARLAGACDYLAKPCSLGDIEAALQQALRFRPAALAIGEIET
jgi:ActR/RegA family two-component response regulator